MNHLDAEADCELRALIDACYNPFVRGLYFLGADTTTTLDVIQSAMVDIVRQWDHIRRVDYPRAYAQKIVLRHLGRHRRLDRLTRHAPLDEHLDDAQHDPLASAAARLTLTASLQRLPRKQREVVVMRYYLDMSEREIAVALGCSTGTVKSRCARALTELRTDLTAEDNDLSTRSPHDQNT